MNLRDYLRLAAIIGTLPNNIQDGDLIDAVPVMNNFNWIVSQVNANIPPLLPSGSNSVVFVSSVGGSGNAITLTPTPAAGSYVAGLSYRFVAIAANTGAVTINVSGLGTKSLTLSNGNVLVGSELQVGGVYDVCYNGTQFVLTNFPLGSALLTWTPALTFGGASTGITYSSQSGQAATFGNIVFVYAQLALTNKGSATGVAGINLPVKVASTLIGGGSLPIGALNLKNVTLGAGVIPGIAPQPNQALANFPTMVSGGVTSFLTDTAFANDSIVWFSTIYLAG